MAVTIYDIARAAGTSHATVSRVLRGRAGIGQETRRKVSQVARELGYRPDQAARMLKAGKTSSIGLILPEFSNPYYIEMLHAAQDLCHERGYQVFPMDYRNDEHLEKKCLELMLERRCDACIAALMRFDPLRPIIEECWTARFPLFVLGLPEDVNDAQVDGLSANFAHGLEQAIEHLVKLGHRHIAFAGSWAEEVGVAKDRFALLEESFERHGVEWKPSCVFRTWAKGQLEDGYASVQAIFERCPETTAILGVNDIFCVGLMRGLAEMGISVPGDVSLVGTDDTWVSQYWPVPLTSISQNTTEQIKLAVNAVFDRLNGDEWHPPRHLEATTDLKVRVSTAPPRTRKYI